MARKFKWDIFGIFDQCAKIYLGLVGTVSKSIQKCIKNENLIKKLEQNGKLKKMEKNWIIKKWGFSIDFWNTVYFSLYIQN